MRYLLTLLLLQTFLFSNNILTIEQNKTSYTIGSKVSYLIDTDNSFTLNEIQSKEFTPHTKDIPNFGFLAPSYWFKFSFNYNENSAQKDWWLWLDYPLLDFVDLYVLDSNTQLVMHKKSGDLVGDALKDVNQNVILFSLPHETQETYTLYLKVKTTSSMLIPMQIISTQELVKKTHLNQSIAGIYYGILLILILYNAMTFAYTREKIYALYVLFVVSYALWQLSFDGLGMLYFWGDIYWMREKGTVFFIYTSTFTLLLFSSALLKAKENIPRYNRLILRPLMYITSLGILASIFLPYEYTIVVGALLAIIVPAILFSAGLIVIKKDYYSIRLFVLGWGIFLIGTILFTLSKFNLLQGYLIMKYAQQIGSAIDMILLSSALVARFNTLQNEYTQKLRTHNKDLKDQVQIALKHERKKDQMLIEQSKLASMGEMIEQIAHQWRQPLNNIGLINQDLYFKNLLGTLTDEDFDKLRTQIDSNLIYMSDTIDDFRTYYRGNKEKEVYFLNHSIDTILSIVEATLKHYKIEILLDVKEGVKVHNIKNELFQVFLNIFNNAKDVLITKNTQNKKISISLTSEDKYAYIKIADNGGGISPEIISDIFNPYFTTKKENKGTGIGLYMSKTIIEKNMMGSLSARNTKEGACFSIKIPLAT